MNNSTFVRDGLRKRRKYKCRKRKHAPEPTLEVPKDNEKTGDYPPTAVDRAQDDEDFADDENFADDEDISDDDFFNVPVKRRRPLLLLSDESETDNELQQTTVTGCVTTSAAEKDAAATGLVPPSDETPYDTFPTSSVNNGMKPFDNLCYEQAKKSLYQDYQNIGDNCINKMFKDHMDSLIDKDKKIKQLEKIFSQCYKETNGNIKKCKSMMKNIQANLWGVPLNDYIKVSESDIEEKLTVSSCLEVQKTNHKDNYKLNLMKKTRKDRIKIKHNKTDKKVIELFGKQFFDSDKKYLREFKANVIETNNDSLGSLSEISEDDTICNETKNYSYQNSTKNSFGLPMDSNHQAHTILHKSNSSKSTSLLQHNSSSKKSIFKPSQLKKLSANKKVNEDISIQVPAEPKKSVQNLTKNSFGIAIDHKSSNDHNLQAHTISHNNNSSNSTSLKQNNSSSKKFIFKPCQLKKLLANKKLNEDISIQVPAEPKKSVQNLTKNSFGIAIDHKSSNDHNHQVHTISHSNNSSNSTSLVKNKSSSKKCLFKPSQHKKISTNKNLSIQVSIEYEKKNFNIDAIIMKMRKIMNPTTVNTSIVVQSDNNVQKTENSDTVEKMMSMDFVEKLSVQNDDSFATSELESQNINLEMMNSNITENVSVDEENSENIKLTNVKNLIVQNDNSEKSGFDVNSNNIDILIPSVDDNSRVQEYDCSKTYELQVHNTVIEVINSIICKCSCVDDDSSENINSTIVNNSSFQDYDNSEKNKFDSNAKNLEMKSSIVDDILRVQDSDGSKISELQTQNTNPEMMNSNITENVSVVKREPEKSIFNIDDIIMNMQKMTNPTTVNTSIVVQSDNNVQKTVNCDTVEELMSMDSVEKLSVQNDDSFETPDLQSQNINLEMMNSNITENVSVDEENSENIKLTNVKNVIVQNVNSEKNGFNVNSNNVDILIPSVDDNSRVQEYYGSETSELQIQNNNPEMINSNIIENVIVVKEESEESISYFNEIIMNTQNMTNPTTVNTSIVVQSDNNVQKTVNCDTVEELMSMDSVEKLSVQNDDSFETPDLQSQNINLEMMNSNITENVSVDGENSENIKLTIVKNLIVQNVNSEKNGFNVNSHNVDILIPSVDDNSRVQEYYSSKAYELQVHNTVTEVINSIICKCSCVDDDSSGNITSIIVNDSSFQDYDNSEKNRFDSNAKNLEMKSSIVDDILRVQDSDGSKTSELQTQITNPEIMNSNIIENVIVVKEESEESISYFNEIIMNTQNMTNPTIVNTSIVQSDNNVQKTVNCDTVEELMSMDSVEELSVQNDDSFETPDLQSQNINLEMMNSNITENVSVDEENSENIKLTNVKNVIVQNVNSEKNGFNVNSNNVDILIPSVDDNSRVEEYYGSEIYELQVHNTVTEVINSIIRKCSCVDDDSSENINSTIVNNSSFQDYDNSEKNKFDSNAKNLEMKSSIVDDILRVQDSDGSKISELQTQNTNPEMMNSNMTENVIVVKEESEESISYFNEIIMNTQNMTNPTTVNTSIVVQSDNNVQKTVNCDTIEELMSMDSVEKLSVQNDDSFETPDLQSQNINLEMMNSNITENVSVDEENSENIKLTNVKNVIVQNVNSEKNGFNVNSNNVDILIPSVDDNSRVQEYYGLGTSELQSCTNDIMNSITLNSYNVNSSNSMSKKDESKKKNSKEAHSQENDSNVKSKNSYNVWWKYEEINEYINKIFDLSLIDRNVETIKKLARCLLENNVFWQVENFWKTMKSYTTRKLIVNLIELFNRFQYNLFYFPRCLISVFIEMVEMPCLTYFKMKRKLTLFINAVLMFIKIYDTQMWIRWFRTEWFLDWCNILVYISTEKKYFSKYLVNELIVSNAILYFRHVKNDMYVFSDKYKLIRPLKSGIFEFSENFNIEETIPSIEVEQGNTILNTSVPPKILKRKDNKIKKSKKMELDNVRSTNPITKSNTKNSHVDKLNPEKTILNNHCNSDLNRNENALEEVNFIPNGTKIIMGTGFKFANSFQNVFSTSSNNINLKHNTELNNNIVSGVKNYILEKQLESGGKSSADQNVSSYMANETRPTNIHENINVNKQITQNKTSNMPVKLPSCIEDNPKRINTSNYSISSNKSNQYCNYITPNSGSNNFQSPIDNIQSHYSIAMNTTLPSTIATNTRPSTIATNTLPSTIATNTLPSTIATNTVPSTIATNTVPSTIATNTRSSKKRTQEKTSDMPVKLRSSIEDNPKRINTSNYSIGSNKSNQYCNYITPNSSSNNFQSPLDNIQSHYSIAMNTTLPSTIATNTRPSTIATNTLPSTIATNTLPSTIATNTVPLTIATNTVPSTIATNTRPSTIATNTLPSTIATNTLPSTKRTQEKTSDMPVKLPSSIEDNPKRINTFNNSIASNKLNQYCNNFSTPNSSSNNFQSPLFNIQSYYSIAMNTTLPSTIATNTLPSTIATNTVPSTVMNIQPNQFIANKLKLLANTTNNYYNNNLTSNDCNNVSNKTTNIGNTYSSLNFPNTNFTHPNTTTSRSQPPFYTQPTCSYSGYLNMDRRSSNANTVLPPSYNESIRLFASRNYYSSFPENNYYSNYSYNNQIPLNSQRVEITTMNSQSSGHNLQRSNSFYHKNSSSQQLK